MRRLHLAAGALAAAAAAPLPAQPLDFGIDPTHSQVLVELRVGLATVRGRFDRARGTLQLDRAAGRAALRLELDATSWSSGDAALDTLVRGPALLDAERHPVIGFRADAVAVVDGERVATVDGVVERAGTAQPLRFTARRSGCYLNPLLQRTVCGGDFEATLPRAALGLGGGPEALGPELRLLVQLEAIAP